MVRFDTMPLLQHAGESMLPERRKLPKKGTGEKRPAGLRKKAVKKGPSKG